MSDEALNQESALDEAVELAFDEANEPEQQVVEQEASQQQESPQDTPADDELDVLTAPQHWKTDIQELFSKLGGVEGGRDWQQFLLDRHKEMEGDYTRKTQELADNRKQFETQFNEYQQFNQMVAPFAQQWQMQGMSVQQGMGQLLSYAQALAQDPQGTVLHLAKQYGVDLESAVGELPYVDPQVQAMQDQLQQTQSALQQMQQQQQESQQTAVVQQIQQFADATDEQGQPLRPHFETVYDQMVQLIQLGHAQDLETAYKKAVQLNPEIQADMRKLEEEAAAKARQVKVLQARQAATVVESRSTESHTPSMSLEEEIEAAFDAQSE